MSFSEEGQGIGEWVRLYRIGADRSMRPSVETYVGEGYHAGMLTIPRRWRRREKVRILRICLPERSVYPWRDVMLYVPYFPGQQATFYLRSSKPAPQVLLLPQRSGP